MKMFTNSFSSLVNHLSLNIDFDYILIEKVIFFKHNLNADVNFTNMNEIFNQVIKSRLNSMSLQ